MKILDVIPLAFKGAAVIRFQRFADERGYFAEHFRQSDFDKVWEGMGLPSPKFSQANESRSRKGVVRGLHFQWNPYMGKLVRTTLGRMVDLVLDIRKGSSTLGKMIMFDMPFDPEAQFQEWIWVPPGFAHGNYFTQESAIEYFCTGEWNPSCEAGISPLAPDLDLSLADGRLAKEYKAVLEKSPLMSEKDRKGPSL
jgi:dTDP-4-dehydrorhamnose 3,5-epimerase